MKLRLSNNVLRLRLDSAEVEELAGRGTVSGQTSFAPDTHLSYSLRCAGDVTDITASMVSGKIIVTVPEALASQWARGEGVSLSATQPIGDGKSLEITIEKDLHS